MPIRAARINIRKARIQKSLRRGCLLVLKLMLSWKKASAMINSQPGERKEPVKRGAPKIGGSQSASVEPDDD